MGRIYNQVIEDELEVGRVIGELRGDGPGPTLVFIGGMHGNEASGVFALNTVIEHLKKKKLPIKGSIHALSGNLTALEQSKRFHQHDLNRLWTKDKIRLIENGTDNLHQDQLEQKELLDKLKEIIANEHPPFYFLDLHTTSSLTVPFMLINDTIFNRRFADKFPIPVIHGIEEFLHGAILSYINELGYNAAGFEAGAHDDPEAIENHISFIYMVMVNTGCVKEGQVEDYQYWYQRLESIPADTLHIYEIRHRHQIKPKEDFKMKAFYFNFQRVFKGEKLALSNGIEVRSPINGRIFMPKYQLQGDDGFFIVVRASKFFMYFSKLVRQWRLDKLLPILPGIRRDKHHKGTLYVNLNIARFFAKEIFHLLGYRSRQVDKTHLIIKNQEICARKEDYLTAPWNK